DLQDEAIKILRQIRQGKRIETYETQRLHKNGRRFDVSLTISPIYDENGAIIGASKIARDITLRKQEERLRQAAELALRDSQQQFESFMSHAPALTWITDINGVARYANSRWLDFVGHTAESALGQPIKALFSPEVAQELLRNNQRVIETQTILETIESVPAPDGEIHTFLICKFPIHQGQMITAVGGIGIDITERTKTEAALKDSEMRWQFALEGAGDGLWDWEIKTNHVFFSRRWKTMLGYEDHEIESTIDEWDSRLHPDDKAQCYDDLERHIKGETDICQSEYRLRCKDGSYKWILDRGKVLEWDENGQPLRMIGTHTDVTDRRSFEAKLLASEATKRAILRAIPDLLLRVGRDGTCYDCLLPQESQHGDLLPIKQHLSEVLSADLLAQQLQAIKMALQDNQPQAYEHQIDKNGHLCYEEIRVVPSGADECLLIVRDITDRKEAEAQLREREEEYRLLVENLPAGVVVHGPNSEIIANNTRATALLGLTTDQMQGKAAIDPAWSFLEEDGITPMPLDHYPINRVLASRKPIENQVIGVRHPDGHRVVWVLANAYPLFSADQTLDRVIVTFVNITPQKQAQFDLMTSEQRYAALAATAPVGIFRADLTGNNIFSNNGWCTLSGLTVEESLGQGWLKAMHPDDAEAVLAAWQQAIDHEQPFQHEHRMLRPDGRVVWVVSQAQIERNLAGEVIGYVGVLTDISDRKQAEDDLNATKEQLELVLQASSEGLWDWNLITNEIYFSPRWKEMLGYADHELDNTLEMWHSVIFADDAKAALQLIEDFNNGVAEHFSAVQRFHHKNGSTVYVLSRAVNVRDDQGQVVRIVGSHLDITSTIHIQEALKNSELQLSSILNSSLDGIMAFRSVRDDQGEIIDFEWLLSNPTACQMVGKRPEELIENHLLAVMPATRDDGLFDLYVQVVSTGTPIQRQVHYHHDDLNTWFETVAVPLSDGFVVTFRDISVIKASEQALQEANTALETHVEHLRQRNDEMTMLSETSDFLQACRTLEEACAVISTLVEPLFPHCSGSFYITAASRNRIEGVAKWGDIGQIRDEFQPHDCWGLRRGRWHHISPERPGLRCNHVMTASSNLTSLCIPMIAQGETLGLFYLGTDQPEALSQPKQQLARTVAEQVGLAIANLHLRESLHNQSIRDSLTGLFNRRYLEEALDTELIRAQRHRYPTAVVMIDVDHFKSFNDQYGHETGDVVLKEIAQVLKDGVRGSDIACRYGGEELVLVLTETSLPDAVAKAEDLRAAVRCLNITYGGKTLRRLTASFGVAVFPDHGSNQARVIQAADAALYRAKAAGRDRVMSAEIRYEALAEGG
ncbi:MAG: PAS domain S-box protein, partial [Leptolyngbya sp.]|nr:PAS domain S-box protein [Leptolyngbya sp.]